MMRRLALVLAAANLAYFLWWRYAPPRPEPRPAPPALGAVPALRLAPAGPALPAPPSPPAPARAQAASPSSPQTAPVPAGAPAPGSSRVPASGPGAVAATPPRPSPAPERAPAAPPASRGAAASCLRFGPYADQETAQRHLARWVARGGRARLEVARVPVVVGYWVYLPAETLAEAEALQARVVAQGLKDYYLDRRRHLVSLGIYSHRDMAERRRRQVERLGFRPRLAPRRRLRPRYWVRVTAPPGALEAFAARAGEAGPPVPCTAH